MLFETKDCKITFEQKEGCLINALVTLSKEFVHNAHKKAIKAVNKEISIPGFRKGKVPDETVLKKFGNHVEQEWKELLINDAINMAFFESKIFPLTKKSIYKPKLDSCSLDTGAVVSFSYEHYPLVPSIEFASISLPKIDTVPVTEQEIQDVLEEICESRASWTEVKDRPVASGDYVDLTLEALEGDSVRPIANQRRFHVAPKKMGNWMQNAIIGKQVGDVVEAESQADDDASEELKANFKKTLVRITILGIFQAQLPELNDAFAQVVGAPSLAELKNRVKSDLERETFEKHKEERYEALKLLLLEKYPFEIPQSVLEEERKERTEMKLRDLRKQNLSEEDIKTQVNAAQESLLEDSKKAIRLYFLTRQMVHQGNIEVTNAEINQFLPRFNLKNVRELPENVLNNLTNSLLQRKIKEYALSQVSA